MEQNDQLTSKVREYEARDAANRMHEARSSYWASAWYHSTLQLSERMSEAGRRTPPKGVDGPGAGSPGDDDDDDNDKDRRGRRKSKKDMKSKKKKKSRRHGKPDPSSSPASLAVALAALALLLPREPIGKL